MLPIEVKVTDDALIIDASVSSAVQEWLQPLLQDSPCGPYFEYDEFLELTQAAEGRPASQFSPGVVPDWLKVLEMAESLLSRTRDLRVAVYWTRARINLYGFSALVDGLKLINGLLTNFWNDLHPLPESGDQYPRLNALSLIAHTDGVCGDLRRAVVFNHRGSGSLKLRAILIAYGQLMPKEDELALSKDELIQLVAAAIKEEPQLADQPRAALLSAKTLASTIAEKFEANTAPDLSPLFELIKLVQGVMPSTVTDISPAGLTTNPESFNRFSPANDPSLGLISSRTDALRAINLVCEYLERSEPSNPAQILLRRAGRLIDQNFLQLIKELAPEALKEAARMLGVDPDSVTLNNET